MANKDSGSSMNPLTVAGLVGLLVTAILAGFFWTGLAAAFYGMLYVARKIPGDVSGSIAGASILFWVLLIFCPVALVIGFISLFLVEIGYNVDKDRS